MQIVAAAFSICLLAHHAGAYKLMDGFLNATGRDDRAINWCYNNKGSWPIVFPSYCSNSQQSPIAISQSNTVLQWWQPWAPLDFENFELAPQTQTITNDGKLFKVSFAPQPNKKYRVSGGRLHWGKYVLNEVVFHFGSTNTQGSEHTLDGTKYPMEMQMIFYHESFNSFETALNFKYGVSILSALYELSNNDNAALTWIVNEMNNVITPTGASPISHSIAGSKYALSSLLPVNPHQWYHYEGSLSVPLCNEGVLWTVFKEKLTISASQLTEFRKLKTTTACTPTFISDNFRDVQNSQGRYVQRSF